MAIFDIALIFLTFLINTAFPLKICFPTNSWSLAEVLQSFKITSNRHTNRRGVGKHCSYCHPQAITFPHCTFEICAIISHNLLSSWFINNSLKKINKHPPHEMKNTHEALVLPMLRKHRTHSPGHSRPGRPRPATSCAVQVWHTEVQSAVETQRRCLTQKEERCFHEINVH